MLHAHKQNPDGIRLLSEKEAGPISVRHLIHRNRKELQRNLTEGVLFYFEQNASSMMLSVFRHARAAGLQPTGHRYAFLSVFICFVIIQGQAKTCKVNGCLSLRLTKPVPGKSSLQFVPVPVHKIKVRF